MQEVQLYISDNRVELFEDETISLTDSIQNIRDISKVFTAFSTEFNIPASPATNKLFKHYYNFDIVNGFDARVKINALIKLNSVDYKKGKIRLNSVSLKDNKAYSYKVVFFGETTAINDILGSSELSTLDLSDYDHTYSDAVVKNGFVTGLTTAGATSTSRDIVYPFISHTTQFVVDNTPSTNSFHNYGGANGLSYLDLKPAIKLQLIVDAIEAKYPSINFSSDFFNQSPFTKMYLWLHREKGLITSGNDTQNFSLSDNDWVLDTGTNIIPPDQAYVYDFDWTVTPVSGTGDYSVTVFDNVSGTEIFSRNNVSGTKVFSFNIDNTRGARPYLLDYKIETEGGLTSFTTSLSVSQAGGSSATYTSPNATESMVGTIEISAQMPKMKIIDFLSYIFKMFNLTSYVKNDIIIVKPLDDYYSTGAERDITKYIDTSTSTIDRALPYSEIDLKYSEPKTFLIKKANEISSFEFGNLTYDGDGFFDGGKYDISIKLEHMMYERMSNQITGSQTEIQWGWFVDSKEDATIGEPLFFFNENRTMSTAAIKWGVSSEATYNNASNVIDDDSITLNFGAEVDEYTGIVNTSSLFNEYYNTYVTDLFNIKSRIIKLKAFLPLSFLLNYTLADTVIINGKKYKINSINTKLQTGESNLELINEI